MSSDPVISVAGVSKAYRIWASPAARLTTPMWETAAKFLPGTVSLRQRAAKSYRDFWALKDVSFEVKRGEAVGIIGRNGSGKSTLLQIIAGTLQPTTGSVKVNGRVAALLELGSGFNPEFTGRENVYLNAAVLGLTREQTEAKFEEIVAFADIGSFIDQPVKIYSSGMQLRLAFAVQTTVEPEILIIDEALSVGDEAFSRKCIDRVNRLRSRGTSLLLVSHSPNLVTTLCGQAVLLDHGRLILSASPKQVITRYHRMIFTGQDVTATRDDGNENIAVTTESGHEGTKPAEEKNPRDESCFDPSMTSSGIVAYEPRGVRILNPRINNLQRAQVNCLSHNCEYDYSYDVEILKDCFSVVFMCGFRSKEGFELGGIRSHPVGQSINHLAAGTSLEIRFRFRCSMLPDTFFLNAGVMGIIHDELTYLHRLVDVVQFRVLPAADLSAAGMIAFGNECTIDSRTTSTYKIGHD